MLLNKEIPFRFIFNKIKIEVLIFTVYAVIIYFLNTQFDLWRFAMPLPIATILGTAISLLLAFRTNQAYDRWWEARKVWGAIVNDSRSLVRQLLIYTHSESFHQEGKDIVKTMAYRQIAWCYVLGNSLRGQDTSEYLKQYLSNVEVGQVKRHDNKPNALLLLQGRDLKVLYESERINAYQQIQIEASLVKLTDAMGKCERIKNTVFPSSYSKFIDFFIYLFIVILPLGMVDTYGIVEVPLVVLTASAFFLIDRTAIHMQDPFENRPTDTAMTSIARTIEINIKQMLEEEQVPAKLQANDFYLM